MSPDNDNSTDSVTTETNIDYNSEVSNLSDGGDGGGGRTLVKLPQGRTTLKFLEEGEVETFNYGTEDNPDLQEKVVFPVEVVDGHVLNDDEQHGPDSDEELHYPVTRGKTKDSQWGQLARVGQAREGLEDEEVTIMRSGTGTGTSYVVDEEEIMGG